MAEQSWMTVSTQPRSVWAARTPAPHSSVVHAALAAVVGEQRPAIIEAPVAEVKEPALPFGIKPMLLDREEAADLYRAYTKRLAQAEPVDEEIRRAYRLIARGETIIAAMDAIKQGGQDEWGLPKLVIARADQKQVQVRISQNGACHMSPELWQYHSQSLTFQWPAGSFRTTGFRKFGPANPGGWWSAQAHAPLIPLPLRPRQKLEKFHLLWEASYHPIPPLDPMLLQRIGKADLWIVHRQWDLTPVERAALATRL